jgi:hypothetical protein
MIISIADSEEAGLKLNTEDIYVDFINCFLP